MVSVLTNRTLARLIARNANAEFKELSATRSVRPELSPRFRSRSKEIRFDIDVSAGTADVRQVFEQAKNGLRLTGR